MISLKNAVEQSPSKGSLLARAALARESPGFPRAAAEGEDAYIVTRFSQELRTGGDRAAAADFIRERRRKRRPSAHKTGSFDRTQQIDQETALPEAPTPGEEEEVLEGAVGEEPDDAPLPGTERATDATTPFEKTVSSTPVRRRKMNVLKERHGCEACEREPLDLAPVTPKSFRGKTKRIFFKRRKPMAQRRLLLVHFEGVVGDVCERPLRKGKEPPSDNEQQLGSEERLDVE